MAVLLGFVLLALAHESPLPILIALALLGFGIGLAFAAMANLIVQSVQPDETGIATGINTIARTLSRWWSEAPFTAHRRPPVTSTPSR